jgi:hypothetical protein
MDARKAFEQALRVQAGTSVRHAFEQAIASGGASFRNQIEKLYDAYASKNYWGDDEFVEQRVSYAEQNADRFEKETGTDIRDPQVKKKYESDLRQGLKTKAMKWLEDSADKIARKDLSWMLKSIRYDQKVMKDLFKIVTGQDIKNLSSAKLKPVLEAYAAS